MNRNYRTALVGCLLSALVALPLTVSAQQPQQEQTWQVNFKDSDIQEVIKFVADVTGKTVVIDPRVKGRVKVISAKPLTSEALYNLFLSVLEIQGYTAIEVGSVVRIVPRKDARTSAVPVVSKPELGDDAYVTEVIQLYNVSAAKVLPVLRPLAPQHAHLAAYNPSNAIIVSDTVANIERLKNVIQRIDRAAVAKTDVISLRHAQASELVQMLQQLEKTDAKNAPVGSKVTYVADKRSNSVLVSGDSVQRERIGKLIERLDVPQPQTGNVRVVYLEYADAEQVAGVLSKVVANISKLAPGDKSAAPASNATVEADADTNALLITADGSTLESLLAVVKRLDIRRAQVLIEAIIVEVEDVVGRNLGVQWLAQNEDGGFASSINSSGTINAAAAGLARTERTETITDSNGNTTTNVIREPAEFSDLAASLSGVIGQTLGVGKVDGKNNFIALVNALKQDSGANILSTPNLLTTDNREASISVGQNVPFVTGSFTTSTGDATNPFQTIQREDVGISLTVTPQINEGDTVVLDIEQEVSSLTGATGASDVITNERKISTQVIAGDGEIIVLGGLIRDDVQQTQDKVPLLGDIPVLGRLFRNDSTSINKTNLMVFLRAKIIRDQKDLEGATAEKYRYIREQQRVRRERGAVLVDDSLLPLLPVWEEALDGGLIPSLRATNQPEETEADEAQPE